ncbi:IS30 family transposase [Metamycoplasma equirhinis]|uniref:IS30 family transposase n=1 Tax=Metamycoplasma equirhinis TaxID=92402 RepID=A0ABZ0PA62_9BACT|nr:IS30 family transposase [Metamycoplasma equirhinis]TPD97818.1 IS30 family transposase [Metamycoplasma equirhinis]WPB53671.1 IS30 family transposase [Metamycoplasma equirhinis]
MWQKCKRIISYNYFLEKKTWYTFTAKIKGKHPKNLNRILLDMIFKYNILVRSITTDNGWEFKLLGLIAYKLGIIIHQCESYASLQKGSNENWNEKLRRFFSKGSNFNEISQKDIDKATVMINQRLRKELGYVFSESLYETEYIKLLENKLLE